MLLLRQGVRAWQLLTWLSCASVQTNNELVLSNLLLLNNTSAGGRDCCLLL
jgi:hypothetical protein